MCTSKFCKLFPQVIEGLDVLHELKTASRLNPARASAHPHPTLLDLCFFITC